MSTRRYRLSRKTKSRTRRLGVGQRHIKFNNTMSSSLIPPSAKQYRKTPRRPILVTNGSISNSPKLTAYGKIYADWCGHCVELGTKWKQVQDALPNIAEFSINENEMATKTIEFKKKFGVSLPAISGFPTIYKLTTEKKIIIYEGARTPELISAWVKS